MRIALLRGKDQAIQALVEFDSVASAKSAKQAMNGADIYSGCCTLKVEFSKVCFIFFKKKLDFVTRLRNMH